MRLDLVSKRVLIFGIEGFTGNHLSAYLQKAGYDVYGTSYSGANEKVLKADITDKTDIRRALEEIVPDFIIVLSGISFAAHGRNEDFYTINTIGAVNILDAVSLLNQNPKKIIMASSATVYGNQGVEVLGERLCPKPTNHYGASKYAMESLARGYFDRLNIIIARPFNYTGIKQEDNFLIPKIIKHFKEKKQIIELGNIDVSREFNDVGYVCEIYKKLLESPVSSEVVNISSNRGIKLLDVIDIMNEIAGYEIEVKINPDFVREGEIKSLTGSTEKLFELIGEVDQREFKCTLRDMLEA